MKHADLDNAIRKGVNRELRFYSFICRTPEENSLGLFDVGNRSTGVRYRVFEEAVLESLNDLTTRSSPEIIRRVTRRHVRRLMAHLDRQVEVPLDAANETEDSGPCSIGNGVFPASSLAAHHVDDIDAEGEMVEYIDRKRRLARFIETVGIESWRWFLGYLRADRKPDDARDRMRFSRLRKRFFELAVTK